MECNPFLRTPEWRNGALRRVDGLSLAQSTVGIAAPFSCCELRAAAGLARWKAREELEMEAGKTIGTGQLTGNPCALLEHPTACISITIYCIEMIRLPV